MLSLAKGRLIGWVIAAVIGMAAGPRLALASSSDPAETSQPTRLRLLASIVPVYVLTANVVDGVPGVELELMVPPNVGCPHHYSVSPADVRKLTRADVVIVNGLGLDSFVQDRLRRLGHSPTIIEAGIVARLVPSRLAEEELAKALVPTTQPMAEQPAHDNDGPTSQPAKHEPAEEGDEGHSADAAAHKTERSATGPGPRYAPHSFGGRNPHVWTSIANMQAMAAKIADELAQRDPANASRYLANAQAYDQRLENLRLEAAALSGRFSRRKVLAMHDILDPMAAELGLSVVGLIQEHAGESPNAARIKQIIDRVRQVAAQEPVVILSEPQYPPQAAKLIARETGQALASIDPMATWPDENPPLDAFERTWRQNLMTLERVLGTTPATQPAGTPPAP